MRLAMFAILLSACGGGAGQPGDAGSPVDAAGIDAGVLASPDLGKSCPMGCNLTLCVITTSDECSNGICAWDGRDGFDSYCSQACDDGLCPPGWTCMPPSDGEGAFCFADPAVCGNGVVERGELCDPGLDVGTPESGCAADCLATIGGGNVTFELDGAPIALEGTSEDGAVTSRIEYGFVDLWFVVLDLQLTLRLTEADLVAPFPRTVQGSVDLAYTFDSWCFANPAGNSLGPVITVESWEDGYHLVGSFDGAASYQRCCSVCLDPEVTSHSITDSHFDVFVER
jgi:hypothetical protein